MARQVGYLLVVFVGMWEIPTAGATAAAATAASAAETATNKHDATELSTRLEKLQSLVRTNELKRAVELARQLEADLAMRAPLDVTDGQLLSKPADGLGIYETADGAVVRGSEIFLYAQVRGHGLRASGDGFSLHLVSDLVVLDASGKHELARDDSFGESKFTAMAPHRDTFINVALRAAGLPGGSYVMRLIVNDKITGKRGQVDIPLKIPSVNAQGF